MAVLVCCSIALKWFVGVGRAHRHVSTYHRDTLYRCTWIEMCFRICSGKVHARSIADIQHIALQVSKTVFFEKKTFPYWFFVCNQMKLFDSIFFMQLFIYSLFSTSVQCTVHRN